MTPLPILCCRFVTEADGRAFFFFALVLIMTIGVWRKTLPLWCVANAPHSCERVSTGDPLTTLFHHRCRRGCTMGYI